MTKVADTGSSDKRTARSYDAAGRRARAAASRRRIVDAAAEEFSEQGYAATTLRQIARRAGVNAKLVVANGPKRDLLLAAFEQRFAGAEGAGPEQARASAEAILAEPDPQQVVQRLADVVLEGQERGIGLWRALVDAAAADPAVLQVYAGVAAGRHEVMRQGIDLLAGRGLLRPGDREQQTATLALLMGFDPYQLMVLDWAWTREQLRDWLVAMLAATLIRVPGDGAG